MAARRRRGAAQAHGADDDLEARAITDASGNATHDEQHQRVVGSNTDVADDDLESPRQFLKKKNAVEALPDSDSPAAGWLPSKARARCDRRASRRARSRSRASSRCSSAAHRPAGSGDSSSADAAARSALASARARSAGCSARFAPKVRSSPHRAQTARPDVSSSFAPPVAAAAAAAPASNGRATTAATLRRRQPPRLRAARPAVPAERAARGRPSTAPSSRVRRARTPGGAAAQWPARGAGARAVLLLPLGIIDRLRAGRPTRAASPSRSPPRTARSAGAAPSPVPTRARRASRRPTRRRRR